MAFEEKVFESDGIKMHYHEAGSGKSILFLHGGGVKALTYKKNIKLLAQKYHVIAPDYPCFGKSSIPKEVWGFKEYADYLKKFIDHLNLEDFVVIGHSFGGGIALCLVQEDKKIKKMILIDSAGYAINYSIFKLFYHLIFQRSFRRIIDTKHISTIFVIVKDFLQNVFHNLFYPTIILRNIKKSLYIDYLISNKIQLQTQNIWWTKDRIFPAKLAEVFKQNIPNSKVEYINGDHNWCLLYPEKLYDHIVKFIEE